jgi:ABC-type branched-subunit amino acid transport system permease subunit
MNYLRSNLTELPGLHLVIFGALMILVMISYPGGVAALYKRVARWIKARVASRQRS